MANQRNGKVYISDGAPSGTRGRNVGQAGRGSASARRSAEEAARAEREKKKAEEQARLDARARLVLQKKEKQRKMLLVAMLLVAGISLGYLGIYSYHDYRTSQSYQMLANIKEKTAQSSADAGAAEQPEEVVIHYTDKEDVARTVLPEYQDLLKLNKNLIGWLKIADILPEDGLPVMQLSADNPEGNTYYLKHNINQKEDNNGTLFADKDCDVVTPGTNVIIYGHHMMSGNMFGNLGKYEKQEFWENHRTFRFDTIYERATYEVMYVFRTSVSKTDDISFKYYQFFEVNGPVEFDSYMQEMAAMSFYDTGVTAAYGDHLVMLSTCDYEEDAGRFVVVGKKKE